MYDIYFDLNNMHQTVDEGDSLFEEAPADSLSELYDELAAVGENFAFEFDLELPEGDSGSADDYPVVVRRSKNGCTCISCGELYPYAEPNRRDGSFKCWSCRHY